MLAPARALTPFSSRLTPCASPRARILGSPLRVLVAQAAEPVTVAASPAPSPPPALSESTFTTLVAVRTPKRCVG